MKRLVFLKKRLAGLAISLFTISLAACVGPRLAERPPMQADTQELAFKFYAAVQDRNREIDTMRAEASLRMSRGIFSRAMDQYILIQRETQDHPERLRIDSYDPTQTLIAQLVYADHVLYYAEPPNGYFRSSADADRLLQEEVGLDIQMDDLLLLFSGGIPLERRENYLAVANAGKVLLRGLDSQVELDEENKLPFRYVKRMPNGTIYEVLFKNYQVINGVWFPIRIALKVSDPEVSADADFLSVELNDPIEQDVFAPPVIPVDAGWGG